ncbi:MAG: ATP synthase F0 subunit C [Bdellovibrionales bacterium]|nr:ATP synthase F0 subunit C [Bdellovibrionales bacterium]
MKNKMLALTVLLASSPAFAQEAASLDASVKSTLALSIGLIMAIAPIGCGIGMGLIGSSGLSGIARNPAAQAKIFIPMIISLAFIEAFVIFGLLVSFSLLPLIKG